MKRMRIVGLCLMAVFAFSAMAVASASAEVLPQGEFGKCVAKAGGKYATSGCTTESATAKKFEWEPLTSPVSLSGKMKEATVATLETEAKTKITCKLETNTGEIANNHEIANVVANFKECKSSEVPCQNAGAGEIVTKALSGVTGVEKAFIKEGKLIISKDKMASELHGPGGGSLAEFECGGFPIVVRGSVLHPASSGKMISSATEKFTGTKAEQKPECFVKEATGAGQTPCAKDEHILESNTAGGPFEEAGQTITAIVTYSSKVELNPIKG